MIMIRPRDGPLVSEILGSSRVKSWQRCRPISSGVLCGLITDLDQGGLFALRIGRAYEQSSVDEAPNPFPSRSQRPARCRTETGCRGQQPLQSGGIGLEQDRPGDLVA